MAARLLAAYRFWCGVIPAPARAGAGNPSHKPVPPRRQMGSMLLWNKLQLEAHKVVDRAHARMEAVQVELSKLEERRTSLEAEMAELRRASSRLADFLASLGTNYMCPYCWIFGSQ